MNYNNNNNNNNIIQIIKLIENRNLKIQMIFLFILARVIDIYRFIN